MTLTFGRQAFSFRLIISAATINTHTTKDDLHAHRIRVKIALVTTGVTSDDLEHRRVDLISVERHLIMIMMIIVISACGCPVPLANVGRRSSN
jgi:hypothetical protein